MATGFGGAYEADRSPVRVVCPSCGAGLTNAAISTLYGMPACSHCGKTLDAGVDPEIPAYEDATSDTTVYRVTLDIKGFKSMQELLSYVDEGSIHSVSVHPLPVYLHLPEEKT
jgi:hypothetical protein